MNKIIGLIRRQPAEITFDMDAIEKEIAEETAQDWAEVPPVRAAHDTLHSSLKKLKAEEAQLDAEIRKKLERLRQLKLTISAFSAADNILVQDFAPTPATNEDVPVLRTA